MISNLNEYFNKNYTFYLNEISYKRLESESSYSGSPLTCYEGLSVKLDNDSANLIIERILKFDPPCIFELKVSYGAILQFNPQKKNDYDWNSIDLADEFRYNGHFVTDNLLNRISLLIAEITTSSGGTPILLPGKLFQPKQ